MAQKIKRHFLKRFITSITLLCLGLPSVLLLTSQLAVAGAPTGSMTSTNQTLTVGVSPVAMNAITITDAALVPEITSGNDIRIKIPAGVNATWDIADSTASLVQPLGTGVVAAGVSFADSNKTLILDVTFNFAAGDFVVISGLNYIPTAASTALPLEWAVDGALPTYLAGSTINTGITVNAADAVATITKANAIPGSTGDLTLVINTGRILAVGEKINIGFPASYTVAATTGIVAGSITPNGTNATMSASLGLGILTLTVADFDTAASALTITIPGVDAIPQYVDATDAGLTVQTALGVDIATDTVVGLTNTDPADARASLSLAGNSVVGTAGLTTLAFTLPLAINNLDTVVFTVPNNLDISGVVAAATDTFGGDGTSFDCTVLLQVLTCTANETLAAGPGTIRITGITSKYAAVAGLITDLAINDASALGADIAVETGATEGVITATTAALSAATDATVTLGTNSVVGTAGDTTITFTLPRALVSGDTVQFTLPANLDITGLDTTAAAQSFGGGGTFDCTVATPIVCTANGAVTTGGPGVITLQGIKSKYAASGLTLIDFEVEDQGGATNDIAVDTSVALVTATTAALSAATDATVTLGANSVVGTVGDTSITFTLPRALVSGDTVQFTLPANLDITGLDTTAAAQSFGGAGTFDCTAAAPIVCTANGAVTTGGPGVITLTGIQSLWDSAGATTLIDFEVEDQGGATNDIAVDTSVAVADTTPAVQVTSSITLGLNATVGVAGTTTLLLTPPRALAGTDNIVWTMPTNFSVPQGAITVASQTLAGGGTFTCTGVAATRVITCTTNGVITADVAGNIVLNGILSLWVSGVTNVADLTINDVAAGGGLDIALDAITAVTATTAGVLSSTNVEPDSLAVGSSSINTITFTTVTSVPNGGKIVVTYPSGFGVSGANGVVATNLSGLDGTWTATTSGQVVTLTQVGGTLSTAGVKSLRIANIVTPGVAGSTGTYTITTTTAGDVNIETNAAVTADTVVVNQSNNNGGGGGGGGGGSADTTPPTNTSVAIVGAPKVPTANVQLTLAATGATEMMISNTADFTGAAWETYNTLKNWTLISDTAEKIVYVKFRDAAQNVSAAVQANVTVDVTAPAPVPVVEQPITGVPFLDIATHWAKDYIVKLFIKGVVQGRDATHYVPDGLLTRAEMVKIALLTFGYKIDDTKKQSFSDVSATHWAASYIALAKTEGIIGGYTDGTFHPDTSITRVEALKILLMAAKKNVAGAVAAPFVDVDQTAWYTQYVNFAFANKVVNGKDATHFDPSANITRAEMAKIAILTSEL